MSIYVSISAEPFILHKNLITSTSALFRDYRFESVLTLPEEDAALFEVYAEWIYSNHSLAVLHDLRAHEVVKRADGTTDQPGAEHLFHLYCLGARLRDVTFKNAVVDAFVDMLMKATECPTHLAKWIYERLPPGNTFGKLYVDMWCWNSDESWFEDLEQRDDPISAPGEFWLDVVKKKTLLGKKIYDARLRVPWVADRTQYYEEEKHETGGEHSVWSSVHQTENSGVVVKPDPEDT
ncbi:hypothetical protein BFW01_g12307 [Lasiodiplodia theobromae]|uniref:uncharacterized protein n=1 Tax=Lasiodiplodia theobromae TaxID=45133 RepID=UPI0015C35A90|nr:uncharacterized protein LTHEOB_12789 [Lasiodiplodia theobromae]KAF4535157.1 hypothetical protein LTHEOB_12789 [Lasiodiplodia theobromae]KAF9640501.1 hypothetical protein BFW01_g12307 [Lasiodiplodia theobromae]